MSVNYIREKIKGLEREIFLVLIIVFTGMFGFGLGRLSKLEDRKTPIMITSSDTTRASVVMGQYVASKTGTAFYLPWCSGVKRIKDSNKVWFNTKEEALAAGYSPAGNCKGVD